MGNVKSLFNKLLGFLLLCLVCSGAVAVLLIRGQMTQLAYTQVLADKDFGGIEFGGRYQVFGQTRLFTRDGKLLARVVVMQPLSAAFFQELRAVLGKEAMVFAGTREVGSTFAQSPGPLQLTPVAPGLFTAFHKQFIGTERDLGEVVVGHIGSQQRTKYGVVGNAVNLTGHIESYTTGGQVLISPTTYAQTAAVLTVSHQLTVEPKGIATPITLYAVSGIGGAHSLCLPTQTETLVLLPQAFDVRYTVLEGKFARNTLSGGRLLKLATRTAELHLDQPVAAFSNLMLHLLRPNGEVVPGELFAKVVETWPEEASRVVVSFTSIPEAARTFLDTMRGYKYHVINRAEQI